MSYSAFYDTNQTEQANDEAQAAHLKREELLRQRLNEGLEYYARHTKRSGAKACLTHGAAEFAFLGLTSSDEAALYRAPQILAGGDASDQIKALRKKTGVLLEDVKAPGLHEGMVLGLGPAKKPGASVDDIQRSGVIFKDHTTGKLMFAEGSATGKKAQVTPLAKVLAQAEHRHQKLFASDLVTLAEKHGAHPKENFRYSKIKPDASRFASSGITATPEDTDHAAALRHQISQGIEHYTKDAASRHVKYKFGTKDGKTAIDCSGFVRKAADSGFGHLTGKKTYGKSATHALDDCSDAQIKAVFDKTGFLLDGDNVNMKNLREGMAIGIDSGDHGWDRNRARGVDHIGTVYKDSKTGKLMFAESSSCKGVHATELDQWLKHAHKRHFKLYAVDLALMADKMGYDAGKTAVATAKRTEAPRVPAG